MSGDATFAGTTYQARVIAFVYVHMLGQMRLNWVPPYDDTPIAVSGETDGPGDDARIEFRERLAPLEVQAKHGLSGGAKLDEVIERLRSHAGPAQQMRVVLAVNRASSRVVTHEFASDLERLRSGRQDRLKAETTRILTKTGDAASILNRLYVSLVDVDRSQDAEMQLALDRLRSVLENPEQCIAAMGLLVSDAADICAKRLRRTRNDLIELLNEANIQARPAAKDERWLRQLDFTKTLLNRRHGPAALAALKQVRIALGDTPVEPLVRYRLAQQTAAAHLQLRQYEDAYREARRALDVDQAGIHALGVAVNAAISLGDVSMARSLADRAKTAHPEDPQSWGLRLLVAVATGEPIPNPPAGVAESTHYRNVLTQVAADSSDWARVIELTTSLLAEGPRTPSLLVLRSNALLSMPPATGVENRERWEEAERITTEAIELLADDAHPYMPTALVLRSVARRHCGKVAEADVDLARARELDSDDPNAIEQAVLAKLEVRDESAALELLSSPVVEKVAPLLALRAQLRALKGDGDSARRDLQLALARMGATDNVNHIRLLAAEAALVIKDRELAERVLGGITEEGQKAAAHSALCARLAWLHDEPAKAEALFREAAARAPAHREMFLAEHGKRLLSAGDAAGAARVLNEVGAAAMPESALRVYGSALMEVEDLVRAQQLIDLLAARGALPDWALSLATNIALRQEDTQAALGHLEILVGLGGQPPHARVVLAQLLLESGRNEDAHRHVDLLLADPRLMPEERMQVAQFLLRLGRSQEALATAFRAFRDASSEPRIHRAFIGLVLESDTPPEQVSEVGPDTFVRLRGPDGESLERTIFSAPPFDARHGEVSLEDAQAAGLLGKRVGDAVTSGRGWHEKRWVVEAIDSAVVHVTREAMAHYEESFPREPFFMTGFSIGDLTSVSDLAPFIASVEQKRAHVSHVQELYKTQRLPLAFIAKMLGGTVPDVMQSAMAEESGLGALVVEWVDAAGHEASRSAAVQAKEVVLTRSALHTASSLDLLEKLNPFIVVAPRSLLQEVRDEVKEAARLVENGQSVLMGGDRGLQMQHLEPGDPRLVNQLAKLRVELAWLESSARIEPRPLATIHPAGSREEEVRNVLGHSSADALALVRHINGTLFADDLGLRRVLADGKAPPSFSSVTLVLALSDRGVILPGERDRLLLELVGRGYANVHPSVELLVDALRRASASGWAAVARVFALLGAGSLSAIDAARMGAQVLKRIVTAPIQIIAVEKAVDVILLGMRTGWPAPLCAQLVADAASAELLLLPQQLDIVRTVCRKYARAGRAT